MVTYERWSQPEVRLHLIIHTLSLKILISVPVVPEFFVVFRGLMAGFVMCTMLYCGVGVA